MKLISVKPILQGDNQILLVAKVELKGLFRSWEEDWRINFKRRGVSTFMDTGESIVARSMYLANAIESHLIEMEVLK